LRLFFARVVCIPFVVNVFCVHFNNLAADTPGPPSFMSRDRRRQTFSSSRSFSRSVISHHFLLLNFFNRF
jgi:hypothetical protein